MPKAKSVSTKNSARKQKGFNQSKNLIYASYFAVTSLSLFAWNSYFGGSLAGFSIPSLLAILAFGYMWVHYFAGWLKTNYEPTLNTTLSLRFSQYFVLFAILAHPVFIITNLHSKGLGLPPASFKSFFGASAIFFISLGTISLFAFLAFEFKKELKSRPKLWQAVLALKDLAMLLILIHGFKLGFIIKSGSGLFRYVWLFYGLSSLYFYYDKYIKQGLIKKFAELFIICLVVWMLIFLSLGIVKNQSGSNSTNSNSQNSENSIVQPPSNQNSNTVTKAELAAANGLGGQDCWVAIDNVVYDATNNPEWKNGQHTPSRGMAKCGQDLTEVIKQSPHGKAVLSELEQVGQLQN